jgi:hypothetical protein
MKETRRFNANLEVTRYEYSNGDIEFVAIFKNPELGKAVVGRDAVESYAEFYFPGVTERDAAKLDPSGAAIAFAGYMEAWTNKAAEIVMLDLNPTHRPAVQDYKGYDFLTILDGKIVALKDTSFDQTLAVAVETIAQAQEIARQNGGTIVCSSSLDFAREYTSDPSVLTLARRIRSI